MKLQKTPNDLRSQQMFLGGARSANFNKAGSSPQLIRHARVGICRSKLSKRGKKTWQWMCEKSIHHMETNKGNNVALAEWRSCSRDGPGCSAAACERPTCCHLQPHADPPGSYPQPPFPYLLLPSADFTPRKRGLESQACRLGAAFIIQWPYASGFLRYWRLPDYKGEKKKNRERCSPTPRCIFKKALPTPSPHQSTSQLLPFQYEAPPQPKEKGIWHTPFK